MKPEQIYQELRDLAEKFEITVSEQNLRTPGINVKSGLCKVKGKNLFVMDKHKSIQRKIDILASQLTEFPHEDFYIIPAIREILEKRGIQTMKRQRFPEPIKKFT
jgi:hypothetical protein